MNLIRLQDYTCRKIKLLLAKPYRKLETILFKGRSSNGVSSDILLEQTSEVKIDNDLIYFIVIRII